MLEWMTDYDRNRKERLSTPGQNASIIEVRERECAKDIIERNRRLFEMRGKGVLWMKPVDHGKSPIYDIEDFIEQEIPFLGDKSRFRNGAIYAREDTEFHTWPEQWGDQEGFQYRYQDVRVPLMERLPKEDIKVDLSMFSHAIFLYSAELINIWVFDKMTQIQDHLIKNGIVVVNPISAYKVDRCKEEFFKLLQQHGYKYPQWKHIESEEDLKDLPFGLPCLVRTNCDSCGHNLWLVKTEEEMKAAYNRVLIVECNSNRSFFPCRTDETDKKFAEGKRVHPSPAPDRRKIIAVEYISPYSERFGCNVMNYVGFIGDEIDYHYATTAHKYCWNIPGVGPYYMKTFSAANYYLRDFLQKEENYKTLRKIRRLTGLHTPRIDFFIKDGEMIFIECGIKLGIETKLVYQEEEYPGILDNQNFFQMYNRHARVMDSILRCNDEPIEKFVLPMTDFYQKI